MQATALWIKDDQLELETKGKKFMTSQCQGREEDCHPSPVDYFAASYAACVGYFVSQYLLRKKYDCKGLKVEVKGENAENPHRIGKLMVEVYLPAGLPEQAKKVAKAAAEGCTIHHTLTNTPQIIFNYH